MENIVGKACLLNIIHKTSAAGKTSARIEAVMALPQGMTAPEPEHELIFFSMQAGDEEIPDGTPEWIASQIERSPEYQALGESEPRQASGEAEEGEDIEDDNVPF